MSDKKEQLERYNHFIFRKRRMLLIAVIAVAAAAVFSMGLRIDESPCERNFPCSGRGRKKVNFIQRL